MRSLRNAVRIGAALMLGLGVVVASFASGTTEQSTSGGGLQPVTLIMMIPGPPQKEQALVDDAISKYLQSSLNIKLDIQQFDYSAWNQRSDLIVASGQPCDVLFSAAWSGFNENAVNGAFVDLTDLVKQYGQDILKSNYTWTLSAGKIGGKLYGIPTYQEMAQQRGFFLRKDLVDKYHFTIKPVNAVTDLEPMLQTIKANEPSMQPLFMEPNHLLSEMGPWDGQGAPEITVEDVTSGKAQYLNFYDNAYYRSSMAIARKWYLAGYVNKDIATTQQNAYDVMKGGNVFAVSAITNAGLEDAKFSKAWGVPIVSFNTIPPIISTSLVQGALFTIPIQSKNRERAMMFIDRMHVDKQLDNMLVYGIEGVDYVKTADNVIGPPAGAQTSSLYQGIYWMMGNQSLLYAYGDQPANTPQLLDQFNQAAVRSPNLGFTYNPEKMKNQIAALKNIAAQYDPGISSGSIDATANGLYDQFLAKLKAGGIDQLLADQNSQLQAWMKQNQQ